MFLHDSDHDRAFRLQLREWLAEVVLTLPPAPAPDDWDARRAFDCTWQRMLFDAGYAGLSWPAHHGGRGATVTEHLIFLEESAATRAPDIGVNFVGLLHAGPTLIAEATPEQQAFHLPRILKGEAVWCQGFSEPNAGSDLASLRTRAVLDGDEFVVTGQKVWTSRGEVADYCELLVRTDPDAAKHQGISCLIMPMHLAGIEVRPLRTIQNTTEFSELFLNDVRVPTANLVGEMNDGWRVANVTFQFERGAAFVTEMLESMQSVRDLADVARRVSRRGVPMWEDDGVRHELGVIAGELDALWALTKRNMSLSADGPLPVGAGSAFKLFYAETLHRLGALSMKVLGRAGLAVSAVDEIGNAPHVQRPLKAFAISIGGGTTQIQRKIIAERVLELPREPRRAP
jgi:alkylation response protein AidB-like acyl-CoA dehydrogenase